MIIKNNAMTLEPSHEHKNGVGTISLLHFAEDQALNSIGRCFGISMIPPGCSIGYHQHTGELEIYHMLEGKAEVCDNGTYSILEPGDTLICHDGNFHSIRNLCDSTLKYIALILYT